MDGDTVKLPKEVEVKLVRSPAVAGTFYPASKQELERKVASFLDDTVPQGTVPKALVVPHAGYIYSGSTAALAYARLRPGRATVRRVVVLGPTHRVALRGLALDSAMAMATPLGSVEIDHDAVESIAHLPQVVTNAAAHAQEHAIEVQLPFLQSILDDFKVVPVAVGNATAQEVAQAIEALWGGPETLIVVSSDLSHYQSYRAAQSSDQSTVQDILDLKMLTNHSQACGATPINGLLLAAARNQLRPHLLGQCNSGDTAGDRARVVGYAAIAFTEAHHAAH